MLKFNQIIKIFQKIKKIKKVLSKSKLVKNIYNKRYWLLRKIVKIIKNIFLLVKYKIRYLNNKNLYYFL